MDKTKHLPPVSCIVPMRNSSTTIIQTLDSINNQSYPVKEIIIVDNVSTDNSKGLVKQYQETSKIPITLIERTENKGVAASYNLGTRKATSEFVIFMHSDATLETKDEMTKLVEPLLNNPTVVATYSTIISPKEIWETYNFWQKCLFSQAVGKEKPGLNGKFMMVPGNWTGR